MEITFESLFYMILIFFLSSILGRKFLSSAKTQNRSSSRLPPGPKGLPIIGHLHLLNNTPHQTFHNLCNRYGPFIHVRLGSVFCIVASSAEYAKETLVTNGLAFASRSVNIASDLLTYGSAGFGFAPYGPQWKLLKKLVFTDLLSDKNIAQLKYVRSDEASRLVLMLLDKARASSSSGSVVNVSNEVTMLSNNIISRMMWNLRCSGEDEEGKEIISIIRDCTEILAQFNLSDFIRFLGKFDLQGIRKRAMMIHSRYDAILEIIINKQLEERKKMKQERKLQGDVNRDEHKSNNFLNILLDAMEDENAKTRVTIENIKALMFDFLNAGTDTSATVVEWSLSELINHPKIMDKARQEIDTIVGRDRLIQESDLPNLPYLQAIFKEALRLHPPVTLFARESLQDCKVGCYDIPAKTVLFLNVWSINRDPNYWKTPLEFRPERFMRDNDQKEDDDKEHLLEYKGNHFDYLPFGAGRRGCPGMSLAALISPRILALLIQCFNWKIAPNDDGVVPKLVDLTERPGLTVPKLHPLMLIPSVRLNPFPTSLDQ
ncbi:Cytochrome p450 [Thalictrum thalictroides]|uniref:Cytochrome p450 n=1 Tax=Thalictrum thalictroides TaxID=46969 RepID=A0A7J6VNM8_THATH|nr:Cytochrome p450 [Thalictrum thalictroides]